MRLTVTDLHKRFGGVRALDGVALHIEPGEVHAVIGENGAGKSTLMNILAGVFAADRGAMRLDGELFAPETPIAAADAGVAIVHQEPQLCAHLSVAENLLLGCEPARHGVVARAELARFAREALNTLLGSDDGGRFALAALAATLSPGDRQLVAIARALSRSAARDRETRILILDEPTSSLTAHDTERLFEAVRRLRDQGVSVLYISHFLEEVQQIADRFTVLRDGASVGEGVMADVSLSDIVQLMVGRRVEELFTRSERGGERVKGEVALEVRELGSGVLRDASFELRRGEVLGIAGLVGSGRTELVRALFGLEPIAQGEVRLGVHAGPSSPLRRLEQGMGMLSEDRHGEGLASNMSIADNLTLSKLTGLGPSGRWGALLARLGAVSPRAQRRAVGRWIERLSIRCSDPGQPVAALSGGNQQKVALARLLYHDVEVLLLDEPTRGVDVASRADVYRLIDELAGQGKAVLMVSSYLPELLGVCDRIAVMRRGRLGTARGIDTVSERSVLEEATGA